MKGKGKLVASSATLEELAKMIGQYWYNDTPYELREASPGLYDVYYPANSTRHGQKLDKYLVRLERGRYRFEAVNSEREKKK